MKVKCDWCGKEFEKRPCLVKRHRHSFCSRECYGAWRSKNFMGEKNSNWRGGIRYKKCEACGKRFGVVPSRANTARFCSVGCEIKVTVKCKTCGKEFQVIPRRLRTAKFCSKECYGKWISIHQRGRNNYFYGLLGKKHPGFGKYPKPYYVKELGHSVRSKWEEEIGVILKANNIPYGYETRTFMFDGTSYTPDFIVGDNVVEVKGPIYYKQENKYREFNKRYPELNFIIVGRGSTEICDVHIPWKKREKLVEILGRVEN